MTPAEILRAAALRVRETAQEATPGPWDYDGNPDCVVAVLNGASVAAAWYSRAANANHISIWHPGVALAVADWLDAEAEEARMGRPGRVAHAVAVARALLPTGEQHLTMGAMESWEKP